MELMGLYKYGKVFKNRMYLNVIYTGYMYDTSYHTAFNDMTMNDLCNFEATDNRFVLGTRTRDRALQPGTSRIPVDWNNRSDEQRHVPIYPDDHLRPAFPPADGGHGGWHT